MEEQKIPNILITGTPGVGKTTVCTLLESSLHEDGLTGYKYIMLAERIREHKLYKDWNEVLTSFHALELLLRIE